MMELKGEKINGTIQSARRELSLEQLGRGSALLDQSLATAGNDAGCGSFPTHLVS
ncbi:MAG: hypothetical protein ACKV0T_08855 [Planctomycetales bacterium]